MIWRKCLKALTNRLPRLCPFRLLVWVHEIRLRDGWIIQATWLNDAITGVHIFMECWRFSAVLPICLLILWHKSRISVRVRCGNELVDSESPSTTKVIDGSGIETSELSVDCPLI